MTAIGKSVERQIEQQLSIEAALRALLTHLVNWSSGQPVRLSSLLLKNHHPGLLSR
jgi:hypothetical protein